MGVRKNNSVLATLLIHMYTREPTAKPMVSAFNSREDLVTV